MAAKLFSAIRGPFSVPIFRNVWCAGVFSNVGSMIQTVAAAWVMSSLTRNAATVALVQTMTSAPLMLFALVSGSIADLYDRRNVTLLALGISMAGATAMAAFTIAGLLTPMLILALCFLTGCGATLFGPAWQASVRDQVPREHLQAAIVLNSISFNLGRSLGPAAGGVIVALAGATWAFVINAVTFVPLFVALLFLRSAASVRMGARENLVRVVSVGFRFLSNTPVIWKTTTRAFLQSFGNSAVLAVMALYVRDDLHGDARDYGIVLAVFGLGAIGGAGILPSIQHKFDREGLIRLPAIAMAIVLLVLGVSRSLLVTSVVLLPAGAAWTIASSTFSFAIQTTAPPWVAGRALAAFQMAIAAGLALGSWFWGMVAGYAGISGSILWAAVFCTVSPLAALWFRMPEPGEARLGEPSTVSNPELDGTIDGRAGPITIQVAYRIAPDGTDAFRSLMEDVRVVRLRNGAGRWTIGRDLADIELWLERFVFPTWNDYLWYRDRVTIGERRVIARVRRMHIGNGPPQTSRLIERSC